MWYIRRFSRIQGIRMWIKTEFAWNWISFLFVILNRFNFLDLKILNLVEMFNFQYFSLGKFRLLPGNLETFLTPEGTHEKESVLEWKCERMRSKKRYPRRADERTPSHRSALCHRAESSHPAEQRTTAYSDSHRATRTRMRSIPFHYSESGTTQLAHARGRLLFTAKIRFWFFTLWIASTHCLNLREVEIVELNNQNVDQLFEELSGIWSGSRM